MLLKTLALATAFGLAAGGWLCLCPCGEADAADHRHADSSGHEDRPTLPHECRCPDGRPALAKPLEPPLRASAAPHAPLAEPASACAAGPGTNVRPPTDRARASPPGQYNFDALYLDHAVLLR